MSRVFELVIGLPVEPASVGVEAPRACLRTHEAKSDGVWGDFDDRVTIIYRGHYPIEPTPRDVFVDRLVFALAHLDVFAA